LTAGALTTHVLDLAQGCPAQGVAIVLRTRGSEADWELVIETRTNADGRTNEPLLAGEAFRPGAYELVFAVGDYLLDLGATGPAFLDLVPIRVHVAEPAAGCHVPLLFTPWSYTVYRGS
jgi:5-hydroxyisourate hydrolase